MAVAELQTSSHLSLRKPRRQLTVVSCVSPNPTHPSLAAALAANVDLIARAIQSGDALRQQQQDKPGSGLVPKRAVNG